jgi:hypothetical protein
LKYVVAFVFCTCVFAHSQEQTFSCPQYTEDMLNYFVMAYPARVDQSMGPGNANPIYSSIVPDYGNNAYSASGYFIWTKSLSGYPWDIKTYDSKFVYDRSTELGWNGSDKLQAIYCRPADDTTLRAERWSGCDAQNSSFEYIVQILFAMPPIPHAAARLCDELDFRSDHGERGQCRTDQDPTVHV